MANKENSAPLKMNTTVPSGRAPEKLSAGQRSKSIVAKAPGFPALQAGNGLCETEADWEFLQLSDLVDYQ